ncbi:MAG: diguanylate cyclase [Rubrivivax sp.]
MIRLLSRLILAAWLMAGGAAWAGGTLMLDDRDESVDAWPAITMLADPSGRLDAAQAWAQRDRFVPPEGPHANLGVRREDIWLRLPLAVQGQGRWVLELDYPPLNHIEVHQVDPGGRLHALPRMGSELPFSARPMPTRAHALVLQLPAGRTTELLLRVSSTSSMVVPITLYRADRFVLHESQRQLLQGLMLGVALALLMYSAVNAVGLRDPMFASYGVMVAGLTVFFMSFGGIGQQHVWHQQSGLLAMVSPLSVLVAIAAGAFFVVDALDTRRRHPWVTRGLHAVAGTAALAFAGGVCGLLDYRATQAMATAIGLLPMLLAVRAAVVQSRQGERAASLMLISWGIYLVGAASMAALLRGVLPAHFWTLHLFQFSVLAEMLVWMRVLTLRIEGVQREAERVELEHQALHSMAHTDPLTGLPNRRGLNDALLTRLARCRPGGPVLAVFLLDLDGFKAVNDRLGHDAGDSLLVQVAHRLRAQLRAGDLVARLGGDEFVVVADSLKAEADARAIGAKLLDAFAQPFDVCGQSCRVGMTAGFAVAPADGTDGAALLRQADAAMYAGKQAGRHCVRRGSAGVALTPAG